MAKIPTHLKKQKPPLYRRNTTVSPPVLVTGLTVKGAEDFLIVNFLDGINNHDENALISSHVLPNDVALTLKQAIEEHFQSQNINCERE
ncbi:hypothetical protein E0H82_03735 [Acinetobacter sp. ANC 4910]|uniref:hypothetical protein n=1 Tax=Acinetobacter sp. ANC 4910 TaxID=2529850 RepID=UPI00103ADE64|nr:hypothetical protein [Acinetobacter sp. ANC 4910]TCB36831.1 hypothetical protein E0H82_03735 [Acinetobacter sp. ANC 4910]